MFRLISRGLAPGGDWGVPMLREWHANLLLLRIQKKVPSLFAAKLRATMPLVDWEEHAVLALSHWLKEGLPDE